MRKRTSTQRSITAASAFAGGVGLAAALLLVLGARTGSALAASPASVPHAALLNATIGITVVETAPATIYQALGAGATLISYTLTLQNPGHTVTGAVVTDTVPAGTTLQSGSPGVSWTYASGGNVAIFNQESGITITASSDVGSHYDILNVPARDRSTIVNSTHCFSGTVDGAPQVFCDVAPVVVTIRAPDFSLVETSPSLICAGGQVTYTLSVTNPGGVQTALPYTVTGQITSVLSVGSISDGGVWSPPNIIWSVPDDDLLANGATGITRTFAVTVSAGTPHGTLLTNTYTITSSEVLPNVAFWQSSGVMVTRPTAAFTSSAPACQGSLVAFYNSSLGATSYQWDFGDGSGSTQANPTHAYANWGDHTIVLTATGACGTSVVTGTVTVAPIPVPVLQIVPDPTQLGVTTLFTDDGAIGTLWNWDFGDGSGAATSVNFTNHTYTGLAGTRTVVMTATAGSGCYSVTSRALLVNPGAPYTVSLSAWPLQPTVGSSAAVTATATDQWGNAVLDGTAITFTATPPPAVIVPAVGATGGGAAHAVVTSTAAGPVTLRGTAPNGVFGTTVVTFTPGAPVTLTLTVAPLTLPAGSGAAITATVVDVYSNPIPGRVITFTVAGNLGGGALVPPTAASDALGQAHATLTSTLPGLKTITATATVTVWDSEIVTFTTGAPYTVTLVADPTTLTVGGTSALTATVTDQFGNVVAGEVISFTTADNLGLGGGILPDTDITDAGGQAHSAIASIASGLKTVRATAPNLVSGTVVVTFQPGLPAQIVLSATPSTQTVGASSQLGAQVYDQYMNFVPGAVITFTTPDDLGLGGITPITDTTSGFGRAYSRITSTLPGPKTAVATAANLVSGTTVVTFTAGAPYSLTLAALPTILQVGNAAALTATLIDQYANPLAGYTVAFATTDPLGVGALTPLNSATDSAGHAASAISSTLPGVVTITATQGALTAATQVTFTIGNPFTVTLVGFPTTLPVGSTAALTATVTDRYANPIPGRIVLFVGSIGSVWPPADLTDPTGQATASISSTLAGQAVVTATDLGSGLYGTALITFTSGAPVSLTLAADLLTLPLGGTSLLTATLRDGYGNPLPGYTIDFATTDPLGLGGLAPLSGVTGAAGEATSAISSTLTGLKTITATGSGLTATVQVTFYANIPATLTLVAQPTTLPVGSTASLTATLTDSFGNPIPGRSIAFTSSGNPPAPASGPTNVSGQVTSSISSAVAGQVVVTATDSLSPTVYGTALITFTVGTPVSLTLVAVPTSLSVGGTAALTATLRDGYGTPLPGYTIVFTTTDPLGSGGLAPLSGVTSAVGEATSAISSTLTGVKTITATGGGLTATAQVTFGSGTLATIVVTPNPVTVTVGATQPFTATGYDQYSNPFPLTPIWTTDGGTVDPGPGATTVFTAQITAAAGRLITATQGSISGTAVINIVSGGAVAIELAPDAATIAAGQTQVYTVTARDVYSNTWDVTALAAYTITPGAGGSWLVNVYTAQVAGSWTVTATYLSLTDTALLTVTHAPTATSAALSPNPYTVGVGGAVVYTLVATDTYGNAWDATASGAYTITLGAGGSWLVNVYTSQYTGTWTVTATVPSATATAVLTVTLLPVASFTRVPSGTVCVNATVQFTDTSSGGPISWLWDFGDSVTTTIQHPAHVYTAVNTYTVTLDVSNLYGSSAASGTVEVVAAPAVGITRTPAGSVCVGTSVAFTATNTGGPATIVWDFGDTVTATGQTAAHAYATPGSYTVWLTATNGCGTNVVSATVTVNSGPNASFVRDPAGDVILGVTIQFTDTSTGGPVSWLWDFGDGVTSTLQHPTHAYTATGTYSVTLTVGNGCGVSSISGTVNVIAGCVPPSITSLVSNSPITVGQTMIFTATVAGSVPITFTWNYGDGTLPVTGVGLVTTSHVYSTSGVFTVTLAVTNACGSASGLLPVTVVAGAGGEPDHMVLVAVPSILPVSNTATLTATVYDVFNVPLVGQVITFTTPDPLGTGSLTPVTATTNAQGQAIATIRSTVVGVKRVTALAYNLVSASTNVTFISGYAVYLPLVLRDYVPPIGHVTLVAYPLLATVGQTVALTATVTDFDGSPAVGVTVQFVTTGTLAGVVLTPPSATTNGSGQAMATLTSASVGVVRVTAQTTAYGSDSVYVYFRSLDTCAPRVIAAVPTGPSPREIAHDAVGRRAFIAHENGMTVIDTLTFAVITDVQSFTGGYGIAYDFNNKRLWVSLWSSDRVVVLDSVTYATLASLPTGAWPHTVEYNPANGRIYVANIVASTVSVYNAATLALERTLANFAGPTHMVVNPATNKIYVVNHNLYGNITVIDGSTHATRRINTCLFDAYDVAVDWDRNLIYAVSLGEGRISIINGATDTVSDCLHIRPLDDPPRNLWLYTIGINPSVGPGGTPHLLVANHETEDGASRLLLLPLRADGWIAQGSHPVRLDVAPYPHNGLLVDTDTERVWLTGLESDMVTVVQDGPTTCPVWDEMYVDLCSNYFNP